MLIRCRRPRELVAGDHIWSGTIYEPTRVRESGLVVPLRLLMLESPAPPPVYEMRFEARFLEAAPPLRVSNHRESPWKTFKAARST